MMLILYLCDGFSLSGLLSLIDVRMSSWDGPYSLTHINLDDRNTGNEENKQQRSFKSCQYQTK